jgi:hypothetical protein
VLIHWPPLFNNLTFYLFILLTCEQWVDKAPYSGSTVPARWIRSPQKKQPVEKNKNFIGMGTIPPFENHAGMNIGKSPVQLNEMALKRHRHTGRTDAIV